MCNGPTINIYFSFNVTEPSGPQPNKGMVDSWLKLTPREREVSLLAVKGMTNNEIAGINFVSHEIVKAQMRSILSKFGLHSKNELRYAMEDSGLLDYVEGSKNGAGKRTD